MNASRELSHTQIAATSGDGDSPEVGVCDRSGVELLREEVVALSAQVATLTQKLLEVDALRRRDADALRQVEALSYSVQQQEVPATNQASDETELFQATVPPNMGLDHTRIPLNLPGGATARSIKSALLDLPIEMLTGVCHHLDLNSLVRVAATCKRFRHGEGGLETVRLPTKSPVITALRALAFPRPELASRMRPLGCSESWVTYLARCARQRRCNEEPPVAAGCNCSLFVDAAGRLMACGKGVLLSLGAANGIYFDPTPVPAMTGVRVRSVAAGERHSLALGWDGWVYSWGENKYGQLGHGDRLRRHSPEPVEALEGVRMCSIAADSGANSLAVSQSGDVYSWGRGLSPEEEGESADSEDLELAPQLSLRPRLVEGFGSVRVRRVCDGSDLAFAIGEAGQVFSWGRGESGLLGHGDTQAQPSPKRVEALRGVRMNSVAVGQFHALALSEDGLVYAWGENRERAVLADPDLQTRSLPKPVEALRGVRVVSIAVADNRGYAVADTGELLAWGIDTDWARPLGHGEHANCPWPKPIAALRGVKVDAVAASFEHTLALADNGSVYAWGGEPAAMKGALGLGPAGSTPSGGVGVLRPRRVLALSLACGL